MITFCHIDKQQNNNITFNGNIARGLFSGLTIKKLEKRLANDSIKISSKSPDNNKVIKTLKEISDFFLNLKESRFNDHNKKFSQLIKLAEIDSQFISPEFKSKTRELVTKVKNVQKAIPLTLSNFKEFEEAERLYIKTLEENNAPAEQISNEIKEISTLLNKKAIETVKRLKNDKKFYQQNISEKNTIMIP